MNDRYYELLSLAGLKEILDSLSIGPDMRSFIESIPNNKIKGKTIDWLQSNQSVSLGDLKAFVDSEMQQVQTATKAPDELTSGAPEPLANWLRFHFEKLSKKNQKQYIELANMVPVIIRWYNESNPDIKNYSLQDVLSEAGLMQANRKPSELDQFLYRVKDPLKSYLYSVLPGLKPEDMDIHPERIQNLMQEGRDAAERGMAASIQNLSDWNEHARPRISKYPRDASGFKEMLSEAERWHRIQCELYPNNDYDPIDSSLIVYGPKWKNSEYDGNFIIELKSENDLKVEGKKMRHCVGNYVNAVESGSSRIFSIRDRSNNPLITIETGPNMIAFRQAYGPGNSQPDGNNLEMVNEFRSILNQNVDIDKLSQDEQIDIAKDTANPELQLILAEKDNQNVLKYLAGNTNLQLETQRILAEKDEDVLCNLAANTNIQPEAQRILAKKDNQNVLKYLAGNPNLLPEIQRILAGKDDQNVLRYLALNPNIQPEIQRILAEKDDQYVLRYLARNPNLLLEVQRILAKKDNQVVLEYLAVNRNLQPEIQRILAGKDDQNVLCNLARNPNIQPEIQRILAEKDDQDVLYYLAENPNLLPELQRILAKKDNQVVLEYLARNPNLQPEIQRILAGKDNQYVLCNLARNPNIQPEIQLILAEKGNQYVFYYLAENPNLQPEIQRILAEKDDQDVLYYLAENPNLDPEVKEMIKNKKRNKMAQNIKKITHMCKDLKLAGEHVIADKISCALSALAGTKHPRHDLSYSYVMRELRQKHQDKVLDFQKTFKKTFEEALDAEMDEPEQVALLASLKTIDTEIA